MGKWIKSRLTMRITGFAFTDIVSGKPVYFAVDCYGQTWMTESTSPFAFRIIKEQDDG